ncbi:MAG: hypothetical protein AB1491_05665 [Thermodesulfobacteriota bacterium]
MRFTHHFWRVRRALQSCRQWSEVPEAALGTELHCPLCGQVLKLNPFTIEADWRHLAQARQGKVDKD